MQTENNAPALNAERIEQISMLSLAVGVLAVFQSAVQAASNLGLFLLAVGTIGILVAQVIQRNYPARIIERLTVVGMMVGILGMLQPWQIWLYENGFYLLALSTLGFIIVSHIGSPETA